MRFLSCVLLVSRRRRLIWDFTLDTSVGIQMDERQGGGGIVKEANGMEGAKTICLGTCRPGKSPPDSLARPQRRRRSSGLNNVSHLRVIVCLDNNNVDANVSQGLLLLLGRRRRGRGRWNRERFPFQCTVHFILCLQPGWRLYSVER